METPNGPTSSEGVAGSFSKNLKIEPDWPFGVVLDCLEWCEEQEPLHEFAGQSYPGLGFR